MAEYITDAVAERVTADLAASSEWILSVDEQVALMNLLVRAPTAPSARAVEAAKRADALFGPVERRRER